MRGLAAGGLGLGALLFAGVASAKTGVEVGWPLGDVFKIAVRFVRVDRGCKIVDRDESSAYLLFECVEDGPRGPMTKRGSLEMYRVDRGGREAVRLQLTLSDEPSYMEKRFLDLFERKVREERGVPPSPKPAPPPAKPDGGTQP